MPRYQFSISTDDVREVGTIHCDSFAEALTTISEKTAEGATLEIGVDGFPPARYERVFTLRGGLFAWMPSAGKLAA